MSDTPEQRTFNALTAHDPGAIPHPDKDGYAGSYRLERKRDGKWVSVEWENIEIDDRVRYPGRSTDYRVKGPIFKATLDHDAGVWTWAVPIETQADLLNCRTTLVSLHAAGLVKEDSDTHRTVLKIINTIFSTQDGLAMPSGNPPYVRLQDMGKITNRYTKMTTHHYNLDLSVPLNPKDDPHETTFAFKIPHPPSPTKATLALVSRFGEPPDLESGATISGGGGLELHSHYRSAIVSDDWLSHVKWLANALTQIKRHGWDKPTAPKSSLQNSIPGYKVDADGQDKLERQTSGSFRGKPTRLTDENIAKAERAVNHQVSVRDVEAEVETPVQDNKGAVVSISDLPDPEVSKEPEGWDSALNAAQAGATPPEEVEPEPVVLLTDGECRECCKTLAKGKPAYYTPGKGFYHMGCL